MADAKTLGNMSPQLLKVAERASRQPGQRLLALAHLIDTQALRRAYDRQRKDAAVGVDGVTKEAYGQGLAARLQDLHRRLVTKQHRHQPILRVHIPKDNGKTRPIGISAFSDKLVQDAIREVLEAVYEPEFLPCSYGFRPGRSAHDAVRAINAMVHRGRVHYILEADIVSYFDSVDRNGLVEMLRQRIADESLMRLIGKCLHAGVLDAGEYSEPGVGTVQGSVLSPLLGNVYLHNVLDLWFEHEVKPRLLGQASLHRYCDDFVMCFEMQADAERVWAVLGKRLGRYGLALNADKTRLLYFGRPLKQQQSGKGPGSFDFLGFTFYYVRTLRGSWRMQCKTRRGRLRRMIKNLTEWCRRHRHQPVKAQHAALVRRMVGHFNYFGVNGNHRSLGRVLQAVKRAWHKWLGRRDGRKRLNWARYQEILKRSPLPGPRVYVQIWGPE